MFRLTYIHLPILLIFLQSFFANSQTLQNQKISDDYSHFLIEPIQGLQPDIIFNRSEADWSIEVDYHLQINSSKNTWINPTNRITAKLRLWSTNGLEIFPKSIDALTALHTPTETTVSNIINNVHPANMRGMKWLQITRAGQYQGVTVFSLKSAFGISFTNDYVLQVIPLIYRADTNLDKAYLVEFQPIKVKLMANGNVQKINR